MRTPDDARAARRLLRWYPSDWRDRYGDELIALVEDQTDGGRPGYATRAEIALAGLRERARGAALVGDRRPPAERLWTGALAVLWGWSLFVLGGAAFQRQSEHAVDAVPVVSRAAPAVALGVVQVLAGVGVLLVAAGAVTALPAFVRFLRNGGWPQVRRRATWAVGTTAACVAAVAGLAAWAHSVTPADRNGGSTLYSLSFVAVGLVVAATLGQWTALAVAAARRIDVRPTLRRTEAALATALFLVMVVITVATFLWWGELTSTAPWVLAGTASGTHPWPVTGFLVTAAGFMVAGSGLAAYGVVRMAGGRAALRSG